MRLIVTSLGVVAFLGLCVSLVVHLATVAGYDLSDRFPHVWLLHVGIFLVFAPAIIFSKPNESNRSPFPYAPKWMKIFVATFFIYAVVNVAFVFCMMPDGGPAIQDDGSFAITSHGTFVRQITETEFHKYQGYETRGFSGHWMLFYCVSMAMHASTLRSDRRAVSSR